MSPSSPSLAENSLTRRNLFTVSAAGLAAMAAGNLVHAAPLDPGPPFGKNNLLPLFSAQEGELFSNQYGALDGVEALEQLKTYAGISAWHGIEVQREAALSPVVLDAAKKLAEKNVVTVALAKKWTNKPSAPIVALDLALGDRVWCFSVDRAGWVRSSAILTGADLRDGTKLAYYLTSNGDPTPPLAVGKPAPDFAFRDSDGLWHRISALRGRRNLLLTFFPKCFTGRCKTHLSSLRDNWPGFLAANMDILAVSVDPAEGERGQQEFSQSLALPFPMLPDTGRNICLLYKAVESTNQMAIRQSILIDKDGIVRHIDLQVQPDTHGQDVLLRAKDLGLT